MPKLDDHPPPQDGGEAAHLSKVGSWEWDFGSGGMTWSHGLYRLLGYEPGSVEPSVELVLARMHPEDRAVGEAAGFAAAPQGQRVDAEFRILGSDGEVRWVANKGEVFRDATGQPSWAAGALFDVTRLRTAEAELAWRERRWRAIFEASDLGEWRADAKGGIVEADFLAACTGRPAQDLVGCGWLDVVHPDDQEPVREVRDAAVSIGSAMEFSFRVRHHSGAYRWILCRAVPVRDGQGAIEEWVGSLEDVDARRAAEMALRVTEQRLRVALDAARMAVWDYDLGTHQIAVGEAAPRIPGLTSGPLSDFLASLDPEDRAQVQEALERTARAGEPHEVECRVANTGEGGPRLRSRATLVLGGHLGPDRIVGVTLDVTAQATLQRELDEKRAQLADLESRYRTLEAVAGGIAWTAPPDGKADDLPGWRDFTGQTVEQTRGWGWLNAVHPADRERVREALVRQIDSRTELAVDYRVRSHTGEYRWFRSRGGPVLRDDGSVSRWIGLLQPWQAPDAPPDGEVQREPGQTGVSEPLYVSGAQVRAARAILHWSVRDLADASGVSVSTIRRVEEEDGLPQGRDLGNLLKIRATLERAGVRFVPLPGGKAGVAPG